MGSNSALFDVKLMLTTNYVNSSHHGSVSELSTQLFRIWSMYVPQLNVKTSTGFVGTQQLDKIPLGTMDQVRIAARASTYLDQTPHENKIASTDIVLDKIANSIIPQESLAREEHFCDVCIKLNYHKCHFLFPTNPLELK